MITVECFINISIELREVELTEIEIEGERITHQGRIMRRSRISSTTRKREALALSAISTGRVQTKVASRTDGCVTLKAVLTSMTYRSLRQRTAQRLSSNC